MKNLLILLSMTLLSSTVIAQTNFEKRIIEQINVHRESMGLAPATFDTAAYSIAKEQVEYMVKSNTHPPIKTVGENGEIIEKTLEMQMLEKNFTGSGGSVSQTHVFNNLWSEEEMVDVVINFLLSEKSYEVNMILPIDPTIDKKYVIGVYSIVSNEILFVVMVLCEVKI